ncbi:hypothetical protein J7T55_003150 [Diaporthe amygdali]|uniref:uncharacterized protein n=1 Tax=Phomopsis amygdali TaxID=1214568 RepID=UPI0022FEBC38|nr:uncharacterized protein J7T55_003150 [Diaporthe amygdali]KAJ0122635.1 hypothetical protein J7T55_003150 [Diaporthe amygdali]
MPDTTDPASPTAPEYLPMEGYLEHAVTITDEKSKSADSITPPTVNDDETKLTAPVIMPTAFAADQERQSLTTLPKWRKWSLFACSCVLQFLLQLDMAGVAVTLTKIATDQNAAQVKIFALATGYFLAQTVFQLVFSHISHAIGRKLMFLTGLALFLVGASIAASRALMNVLIFGRVVQGIGAAGMFTMSAIVIVDLTQPRQRAGWQAISQAFGALGNICGPLMSALLINKFRLPWSSIFVTEAVLVAILFLALLVLLPCDARKLGDAWRELRKCDWIGMLAFFVCSVSILTPINIGGATTALGWKSAPVMSCFAVGVVSLGFLIMHQRCLAGKRPRPAFPREVFSRRVTNIAFLGTAAGGVLLSMVFYNLVFYFEGVRHLSTKQTGIMLLSVTLTYPVAYMVTGLMIRRWGHVRPATVLGSVLATTGLGLMQLMTEDATVHRMLAICMCAGAGCGILAPAMVNTVLASTEARWHPHAIATRTLIYTAGQCIGVSVGLAIFTNAFEAKFGDKAVARGILANKQGLLSKINELQRLKPDSEVFGMIVESLSLLGEVS